MMRRLPLLLVMLMLTGCLPLSVNPLFTEEGDVVYDEALLGRWTAGPEEQAWGTWEFAADDKQPNRYALSITDQNGQVGKFRATLVQLGERRFLDLNPVEVDPKPEGNEWFMLHLLPMHSFLRITVAKGGLAVAFADVEQLDAMLRAQPGLVAHTRTTTGAQEGRLLFTADSASLQAFVRDTLDDATYFDDVQMLVPVTPDPAEVEPAPPAEAEPSPSPVPALYD